MLAIPDELIPEDSRVEIDAKIHAGYFTTGKTMTSTSNSMVPSPLLLCLQLCGVFRVLPASFILSKYVLFSTFLFTVTLTSNRRTVAELNDIQGRPWEDVDH